MKNTLYSLISAQKNTGDLKSPCKGALDEIKKFISQTY